MKGGSAEVRASTFAVGGWNGHESRQKVVASHPVAYLTSRRRVCRPKYASTERITGTAGHAAKRSAIPRKTEEMNT